MHQTAEGTYGMWPQLLHELTGVLPGVAKALQPDVRDSFLDQVGRLMTVLLCLCMLS